MVLNLLVVPCKEPSVDQKLTLLRNGAPLPAEVVATEGQLTGSVRYLFEYVSRMLKLTPSQLELIKPGFDTLDLAIGDKIEDWNQVFLHVLEELRQKGVELEQREALLRRMRRDGRTLLYRRELGEERLLTTLREGTAATASASSWWITTASSITTTRSAMRSEDPVLSTTGRLFRMHREGDIGVRWGGDEFLRIVRNLVTETQLGGGGPRRGARRIVAWDTLDQRFTEHPPRLSIGLLYCERPSREERSKMLTCDDEVKILPEQRFDASVAVPTGSTYDIRTKARLAGRSEDDEAKRTPGQTDEPHIAQTNVLIVDGRIVQV
jgi:hypothetical protein